MLLNLRDLNVARLNKYCYRFEEVYTKVESEYIESGMSTFDYI